MLTESYIENLNKDNKFIKEYNQLIKTGYNISLQEHLDACLFEQKIPTSFKPSGGKFRDFDGWFKKVLPYIGGAYVGSIASRAAAVATDPKAKFHGFGYETPAFHNSELINKAKTFLIPMVLLSTALVSLYRTHTDTCKKTCKNDNICYNKCYILACDDVLQQIQKAKSMLGQVKDPKKKEKLIKKLNDETQKWLGRKKEYQQKLKYAQTK